ncbi:hypothetical protein H6G00_01835 [Leptolyngbya sp. FACHB-541]|uniref:hypothetical protein n=1 Tax=Leptolyngbya sp. FACHB-541 TaxID=2692810 RepID=UPI0016835B49|nr:hypothetical protein [Leptolyngbya sp. FACHB-541]MBD1995372.1 hypothetical protein [Leptolyngbya sp. FACHB-541]
MAKKKVEQVIKRSWGSAPFELPTQQALVRKCVKLLRQGNTPTEIGDAYHFLGEEVFNLALAQLSEPEQNWVRELLASDRSDDRSSPGTEPEDPGHLQLVARVED